MYKSELKNIIASKAKQYVATTIGCSSSNLNDRPISGGCGAVPINIAILKYRLARQRQLSRNKSPRYNPGIHLFLLSRIAELIKAGENQQPDTLGVEAHEVF